MATTAYGIEKRKTHTHTQRKKKRRRREQFKEGNVERQQQESKETKKKRWSESVTVKAQEGTIRTETNQQKKQVFMLPDSLLCA